MQLKKTPLADATPKPAYPTVEELRRASTIKSITLGLSMVVAGSVTLGCGTDSTDPTEPELWAKEDVKKKKPQKKKKPKKKPRPPLMGDIARVSHWNKGGDETLLAKEDTDMKPPMKKKPKKKKKKKPPLLGFMARVSPPNV